MKSAARRLQSGLATLVVALGLATSAAGAEVTNRVLMISVDGLMPAYWQQADALGLKIPNLRRLVAEGAHARVVGVLPTVTYPSHTTLITGVPPRVHGIGANTFFDPEEKSGGAWRWYASEIRARTLVSAARSKGLLTGSVSWPVSLGDFADWNVPEYWRPGSSHPSDAMLFEAVSTRGLVAAMVAERRRPVAYPVTDTERTDAATYILQKHKPRLQLLHIFDLDDAEHDHGPMSAEALAAVERSDACIGQVLAALDTAGTRAETLVAIVSDHGFLPAVQGLRPNAILREAGLLKVGANGKITEWQAAFHSFAGSAALYVKDGAPPDVVAQVRRLFEPKAKDPAGGVREILDADAVRRFGGVDVPLLLNAREGFAFSSTPTGGWLSIATNKGIHGHVPDRDELHATLILVGPGLSRKGDLGVVAMTRIAPTLARFLDVELSPEADQPLP